MLPRIKICCIASREEAVLAIAYGASALGLVSKMPSGPGPIDEETIADIAAFVPPPIATFLLTSESSVEAIAAQARRCRPTALQLVDHLAAEIHHALRHELPGVKLVQVVHVGAANAMDYALDAATRVDALLLDSGDPVAAVKTLGGTGQVHDWALSRRIVERASRPVFIAGGLTAENVGEAIRAVRPFGVDLCTGVRSEGWLDPAKLADFIAAVRDSA